jgi:hypothetical protein
MKTNVKSIIKKQLVSILEAKKKKKAKEIAGSITKQQAEDMIKASKGKIFTVTFIKKDGSTRVMNARLGVKAYLQGGKLPYNPEEKGLLPLFDIQIKSYRVINLSTINELTIGGKTYEVK